MTFPNLAPPVGQGPGYDGFAVTKSDTTIFAVPTRAIWVGGTGDLTVTMQGGTVLTFTAVPAGTWLDLCTTKVMSTGTTATLIVGLT